MTGITNIQGPMRIIKDEYETRADMLDFFCGTVHKMRYDHKLF